ncbi:MAG: OmpA family protein [Chloroherpetonaceae bacterium]|nr:OmpA family protein [Chloroherpetonaceae bacterium]
MKTKVSKLVLLVMMAISTSQVQAQLRGAEWGFGFFGGMNFPTIDYPYKTGAAFGVQGKYFITPEINVRLRAEGLYLSEREETYTGFGRLGLGDQIALVGNLGIQYNFFLDETVNPYAHVGASFLFPGSPTISRNGGELVENTRFIDRSMSLGLSGGAGFEFFLNKKVSFDANLTYTYLLSDRMEAAPYSGTFVGGFPTLTDKQNESNDMYFTLTLGMNFYFGENSSTAEAPKEMTPVPIAAVLPPAVIQSFTASPSSLVRGKQTSATLSWEVTGADTAMIAELGGVSTKGSKEVPVTENKTFTISATGKDGKPVTKTVSVEVKEPVSVTKFTVYPKIVARGEGTQVKLQWESKNAESVSISGVGTVSASGYKYVTVDETTTFTLTATGGGGPVTLSEEVKAKDIANIESGETLTIKVEFATGSAKIEKAFLPKLDSIALKMYVRKELKLEISGHTDNTGPAKRGNETDEQNAKRGMELNAKLSLDRAKAVKDYLVRKKVDSSRLQIRGAGQDEPIDDNNTEEGRARNRRIEFKAL